MRLTKNPTNLFVGVCQFAPITKEELAAKIIEAFKVVPLNNYEEWQENYGCSKDPIKALLNSEGHGIPWKGLTSIIQKDLSKCDFDTENVNCKDGYDNTKKIAGFQTLPNGLTYLGISSGGDWEFPIFYIVYYSGKELRCYIPLSGNPWNTDTKQAYGNNESDDVNAEKRFGVTSYQEAHADGDLILKEIEKHIVPKSITPKSIMKKATKKIKLTEDLRTRVEFARGSCFKDGKASWPWHWNVLVQNGHPYASSKDSFDTFEQCLEDFNDKGKKWLDKAQKELKKYKIPDHEEKKT